jgi:hypothetical protein
MAKFGKDLIYRTKVIVQKPVWTPARHRHTQSHNTARLETGVLKGCCENITSVLSPLISLYITDKKSLNISKG